MMLMNDNVEKPLSSTSRTMGINILRELSKHYPALKGDEQSGWICIINEKTNIIQITNSFLRTDMGFVKHISKLDLDYKDIMRAGGEILERFNVERSVYTADKALKDVRYNYAGQAITV